MSWPSSRPNGRDQGIRFVLYPPRRAATIEGDEELLRQALIKIGQNACQAMPTGVWYGRRSGRNDLLCPEVADEGGGKRRGRQRCSRVL